MNFRRCSHSIEPSTAGRGKKRVVHTDLTVVSSYHSPSKPPAIVAALLLSPRLSGLPPHARVRQPSRHQECAQVLPCCAERGDERVQTLEIIGKEKKRKGPKAPAPITDIAQMEQKGRGSETWVTPSSLAPCGSTPFHGAFLDSPALLFSALSLSCMACPLPSFRPSPSHRQEPLLHLTLTSPST